MSTPPRPNAIATEWVVPYEKSHGQRLTDPHGHAASTHTGPTQTQGNADDDHHDGDEGIGEAAIIIGHQPG